MAFNGDRKGSSELVQRERKGVGQRKESQLAEFWEDKEFVVSQIRFGARLQGS